ncbi:tyrosine-type recombinase/integrase [uncultured Cohaesibacter sp.]|uniref:tyrosine-type recombinase/integrase n=1 Tax=uncultured Cohaesibacter sp. TaxID=1002546 RepID=UPI0029C60DEE|nr:tyrosine-type recombinase/integrase [uncultured Cohaesibacter sp.]
MSIRKNLRQRTGGGWAVVFYVPHHLRKLLGKREIVRGLGTKDLREANRRKTAKLAEIYREAMLSVDPVQMGIQEAKRYHPSPDGYETLGEAAYTEQFIEQAEKLEKTHGLEKAKLFYEVATHQKLPLSVARDLWISEADGVTQKTRNKYHQALTEFIDWVGDLSVTDVTRRRAMDYLDHIRQRPSERTGKPLSVKSVEQRMIILSSLYSFLRHRGFWPVEKNSPFHKAMASAPGKKKPSRIARDVRPITKEELRAWIRVVEEKSTKWKQEGADLLTLLWHTGCRAGEICELSRHNIEIEEEVTWICLDAAKTESGVRSIPVVSPQAQAILKRLCEGLKDESPLFPRMEPAGPDNKRYHNCGKALNKLRRENFPDQEEFDVHSMRRRFSAACEDAGIDEIVWDTLMGHASGRLAKKVYNRRHDPRKRTLEAMRLVWQELGEV